MIKCAYHCKECVFTQIKIDITLLVIDSLGADTHAEKSIFKKPCVHHPSAGARLS